mmetsp:Transcript_19533/g.29681  ORF Transcript_19533/g.29681 Transcript_19533/m.29681 type:complete len:632 (+) Transcript_19533:60-1955(+)
MMALLHMFVLFQLLICLDIVSSQAGVDTNQVYCYDDAVSIECESVGSEWFGQDGNYAQNAPSYQDNGDGTVTDLNTGLMWEQGFSEAMYYREATRYANAATTGGYDDWRLPTITELYSLIQFDGITATDQVLEAGVEQAYIDTDFFDFEYGAGEDDVGDRTIDVQFMTSTLYVWTTMNGDETMFGVNFADGRIKGYPTQLAEYYVRLVRGTSDYDSHNFILSDDGLTIYDSVWDLTWMQADDGNTYDWQGALNYCENLDFAGESDWRLPNAKELQALVDYTRSPDTTSSPAIDSIFDATSFTNEGGDLDWGYYWTSTTHLDLLSAEWAVYIAFGRGLGYFNNQYLDVHGAGVQRSDPKSGETPDPTEATSPQGDIIRIFNFVRCVRGGSNIQVTESAELDDRISVTFNVVPTPAFPDIPPGPPGPNPNPKPTPAPTPKPTPTPLTPDPTPKPTPLPSPKPTLIPTLKPTAVRMSTPTEGPSVVATVSKTVQPTSAPTAKPMRDPTPVVSTEVSPSLHPSATPSLKPILPPTPRVTQPPQFELPPTPPSSAPTLSLNVDPPTSQGAVETPTNKSKKSNSSETNIIIIVIFVVLGTLLLVGATSFVLCTSSKKNKQEYEHPEDHDFGIETKPL